MTRTTAREIAMHLIYELDYHDELPEELLQAVFSDHYYPRLAEETDLYQEKPNAKQMQYIENLVRSAIAPETIVAAVAQNTVWNTRKPSTGRSLS